MNRMLLVAAVVVAGALAWYCLRPASGTGDAGTASAAELPPPAARVREPGAAKTKPLDHVRQLASIDERERIERQIEHAHAVRAAATRAAHAPSLPALDASDRETLKTTLRAAMREAIPYLAHCYEDALPTLANPSLDVPAHLTLTGDPDVGTLIDAAALADDKGVALPAKLDDCLRDALQKLELPPLAEGDRVEVTYPFSFRNQ